MIIKILIGLCVSSLLLLRHFWSKARRAYALGLDRGALNERISHPAENENAVKEAIIDCARSVAQKNLICVIVAIPQSYIDLSQLRPIASFGSAAHGLLHIHKDALQRIAVEALTRRPPSTSTEMN